MKRLVIYFHYDAQGLLDEPCRFALQEIHPFGDLFLVTNGSLRDQDCVWARQQKIRLLQRENVGFDVGAYRQALLALGREKVASYDELVLMNYTLAGPVCSLKPMFERMEARTDLDFWGLTRHYTMRSRRFGGNVPEHLQSHFLAIRRSMLCEDAFWNYWQGMRLPRSYEESVIRHETRFTGYFQKLGFSWDSYVATDDLRDVFLNPIMACPKELLEHRECPFFKRRSFFTPYEDELRRTDGNAAGELLAYLAENTQYPVSELIVSLLRSHPLSVLMKNLHWHYILPEQMQQEVDLMKEGLELIRFPIPEKKLDAVTSWYLRQKADWANQSLAQAVQLFQKNTLLGALCPALPAWPKGAQWVDRYWSEVRPQIVEQVPVPTDVCPPPAPCAGWLLVRKAAFPQGIPAVQDLRQAWMAVLLAQKNGYYTADFDSCGQAAGRTEQWHLYTRAAQSPFAVAKQLGRLVKHTIQR